MSLRGGGSREEKEREEVKQEEVADRRQREWSILSNQHTHRKEGRQTLRGMEEREEVEGGVAEEERAERELQAMLLLS
jgi:hypothetical protein